MRLDNTGAFSYLFSSWVTGILFFEVKSNGYFSINYVYMYTIHGKRTLLGQWMKLHAK